MKITFDAHPLVEKFKSGIGMYEYNIIKSLIDMFPEDSYYYNFFSVSDTIDKINELKYFDKGFSKIHVCDKLSYGTYKAIWNLIPLKYQRFFNYKSDISHFFNYMLPPGVHGKKIITVYDMVYKAYPEVVRFKTKTMLNLGLKKSIKNSDKIITISEFSKSEIIKYFPECEDKIDIVYCGVDYDLFRPISNEQAITNVKNKYGITGQYLLYLGTLEPRKNIERLIEAYSKILKDVSDPPTLVISGGKGWMYDTIFEKVNELNISSNIIFTGYIDKHHIPILLSGAVAFIFPSLYEGFGLPVLEAMACGTPVITSNLSSLPEVVGDAAILVDPYSVEAICEAIIKVTIDEALRESLSKKGIDRSKLFSWDAAALKLHRIYEGLLS
jgi:glycosyltransferase involved in cell wall biosynthesis